MGNRRNLRRASSQEEDEGDVFDDKSEISSGSDEEESSRGVDALGGSSDTAVDVGVSSSTRCVAEPAVTGGHFAVSTNRTKAFAEAPADAETRSSRKAVPETDVGGPRRGIPRGDGGKPRIKTTWQLMQEDPSFVPRETRYFLHDDRRDCDGEESEASKQTSDSDPETSLPKSTQTRVGQSKKLWTPDEDKGVWKHDMWEQLQKDDAEALTTASSWTRGRSNAGRRGGFYSFGRGRRGDNWGPRAPRGGRSGGSDGYSHESWRGGWRPRGRSRGQGWSVDGRKQYVPRQTAAAE
ncbi:uncharacterized protein LOC34622555 [Cyclospora cayetanensis]|uniref:Uncharacterized protein LOC34622555 n=1 Tax=Cyclospora cayetanensis TaxID=88456 RepID=A0A6P6RXH5_9EIME|nr:uncharacterized protein LOC34622555 [Cyclospora cayetanensis]